MSSFRRGVGLVKPNARFFVRGRRVCRVVSHAVGCRRVGNLALVGVVEPRTTALAGFALTLGVWGYPYSHVSKLSPLGVWARLLGVLLVGGKLSALWRDCARVCVDVLYSKVNVGYVFNSGKTQWRTPDDFPVFVLWQASVFRHRLGVASEPMDEAVLLRPWDALLEMQSRLKQTYRVRYCGIDRKLRKIVKNKYRYVRAFECLRGQSRFRQWARHVRFLLLYQPGLTRGERLAAVLFDFLSDQDQSMLVFLQDSHQLQTVQALALRR